MRQLGISKDGHRQVAFYHRNSSDQRKAEILSDLKLPLDSPVKNLLALVATVSLGMYLVTNIKHLARPGLGSAFTLNYVN